MTRDRLLADAKLKNAREQFSPSHRDDFSFFSNMTLNMPRSRASRRRLARSALAVATHAHMADSTSRQPISFLSRLYATQIELSSLRGTISGLLSRSRQRALVL